ncbi:PilW family protein [Bowmanella dokdonensis]|uniref:PilW family protein n=1 Tax=Bowmanella dokdonensis TaxID=751969 RepID=A0A939DQX0_9ALTE|nr:PilW family protein [Bowmanella dokdonensis]MBN7827094.1 PilW family protein [Bowmanella dokdonensis]
MKDKGFSLVELMISLTLGLLISGAIVQVMVSNQVTERLNRAVASVQENGRYFITRIRGDLMMTGFYDTLSPDLDRSVDIIDEESFLQHRAVVLPGDFVNAPGLGAQQGANGANDRLVVAFQASEDCRGAEFGYGGDEFFVVNEYYIDDEQLKCRGYDGRVLRGLRSAPVGSDSDPVVLLDQIASFQLLYGIANNQDAGDFSARPIRYVAADQLAAERLADSAVVTIRIAVLLKGDGKIALNNEPDFRLLTEEQQTPPGQHLFKQFETTISLRNLKNQLRSRKI